jgi:hypothetical protein
MRAQTRLLRALVACATALALVVLQKEQRGAAAWMRLPGAIPLSAAAAEGVGGGFRGSGGSASPGAGGEDGVPSPRAAANGGGASEAADPAPPPRKWPETEEGRACSALHSRLSTSGLGLGAAGAYGPSAAWSALAGRILNASYYPGTHADHPDLGPAFRGWIDMVFAFYEPSRLRSVRRGGAEAAGARREVGRRRGRRL